MKLKLIVSVLFFLLSCNSPKIVSLLDGKLMEVSSISGLDRNEYKVLYCQSVPVAIQVYDKINNISLPKLEESDRIRIINNITPVTTNNDTLHFQYQYSYAGLNVLWDVYSVSIIGREDYMFIKRDSINWLFPMSEKGWIICDEWK